MRCTYIQTWTRNGDGARRARWVADWRKGSFHKSCRLEGMTELVERLDAAFAVALNEEMVEPARVCEPMSESVMAAEARSCKTGQSALTTPRNGPATHECHRGAQTPRQVPPGLNFVLVAFLLPLTYGFT